MTIVIVIIHINVSWLKNKSLAFQTLWVFKYDKGALVLKGGGGSVEVGQKVQVFGVWNIIFASEKAKFHSKRSKWKYIPLFIIHLRKISSMYLQQFSSKSQGHLTHISRSNFKHNSRMLCALILNEFDKSWKK